MDYEKVANKLENLFDAVDGSCNHSIDLHVIDGFVCFYDNDELLCSEMTVNSLIAILNDYDGDAEKFYRLFRQDAIDDGFPSRLDIVEIYPNNKSCKKYSNKYFDDYKEYNSCSEWYEDGDELVVFLNVKTGAKAVYRRFGSVYCLADRFGIYCCVDMDDGDHAKNDEIIRGMLVQEAIDAGFPMTCPD